MILAALSGFASESMTREAAWRFLDMGRRLERALNTALVIERTLRGVRRRRDAAAGGAARRGRQRDDLPPPLPRDAAGGAGRRSAGRRRGEPALDPVPAGGAGRARRRAAARSDAARGAAPRSGSRSRRCPRSACSTSRRSARAEGDARPALRDLCAGLVANMQRLSDALSGSYLAPATALARRPTSTPAPRSLARSPRAGESGEARMSYRVRHITEYLYSDAGLDLAPRAAPPAARDRPASACATSR